MVSMEIPVRLVEEPSVVEPKWRGKSQIEIAIDGTSEEQLYEDDSVRDRDFVEWNSSRISVLDLHQTGIWGMMSELILTFAVWSKLILICSIQQCLSLSPDHVAVNTTD